MTIRSWTDAEVISEENLTEMRDSQAKARAYGREIVRLRELMRGLEQVATDVMAEHDEETTGSAALDALINVAMALATEVRPPRGTLAPSDGYASCPVCSRAGAMAVKAGDHLLFCAQCSLGEQRMVRLVFHPATHSQKAVPR